MNIHPDHLWENRLIGTFIGKQGCRLQSVIRELLEDDRLQEFNKMHNIVEQFVRIRVCGKGTGFFNDKEPPANKKGQSNNEEPRVICTFAVYSQFHISLIEPFLEKFEKGNLLELYCYYDYLQKYQKLVRPEQLVKFNQAKDGNCGQATSSSVSKQANGCSAVDDQSEVHPSHRTHQVYLEYYQQDYSLKNDVPLLYTKKVKKQKLSMYQQEYERNRLKNLNKFGR